MSITDRSVVSIGNFDGVHLGHRAIIRAARRVADELGCQVTAITFDPSPAALLQPGTDRPRLMTADQKAAILKAAGADDVVVLSPTRAFLSLSPEQFLESVVEIHATAAFVEGPDFRFGRNRTGDNRTLRERGKELGYQTHIVNRVDARMSDNSRVSISSSLIRWLIRRGRVGDAASCLGSDYHLTGRVAQGEGRGRQIGVPTANLDPADLAGLVLPADGVYGGYATLQSGAHHPAAISVGTRPTFGQPGRRIEAHVLDYEGNLYGEAVTLHWTRWVRDQWLFPDAGDLRQQILRDLKRLRHWLRIGYLDPQGGPAAAAA